MNFNRSSNGLSKVSIENGNSNLSSGRPVLNPQLEALYKQAKRRKPYPRFSSPEQAVLHRIQKKKLLLKVALIEVIRDLI